VNGIRAIAKKGFLDWFDTAKPDVLCIQEIKAQVDQLPKELKHVSEYHSYFNPAERKGYSGVATYSSVEAKEIATGMGIAKFDHEGRFLRTDFDDFILLNVYWPNGGMGEERLQYKLDFYDAFLNYTNNIRHKENNHLI